MGLSLAVLGTPSVAAWAPAWAKLHAMLGKRKVHAQLLAKYVTS